MSKINMSIIPSSMCGHIFKQYPAYYLWPTISRPLSLAHQP